MDLIVPLECEGLTATAGAREVLIDVRLSVGPAEAVAVVGPSGSGKTTLLNCVAGLWPVESGLVRVAGEAMTTRSRTARNRIRRERIGYVFQFGELLPELSVLENVCLPRHLLTGRAADQSDASGLLEAVGLGGFESRDVQTLSGGEVQRVAIARALSNAPALLLADEPTGAVDEDQSAEIIDLLVSTVKARRAGLLVATHDPVVAQRMDRVLRIRRGTLSEVAAAVP